MGEELKEVWTTQIRPVAKFSNNDYYRSKDKGQIEAFDNLSEYKPTYLPVGAMGYDGNNKIYRQLKTIKVKRQDGGFDYYMVPEFAVEGVYVDQPKQVVEPIPDLASQSNQQAVIQPQQTSSQVPPKPNTVTKQPAQKPVTTKSNPIVKQPVPQNLLPYIANVTSDGVVFFNVPDGYTPGQFEQAVKAVYGQNKGLAQKPMAYYQQPQQQIQQQQQQQQTAQQHQKQYLIQRQQIAQQSQKQRQQSDYGQNVKYNTNNAQADKKQTENTDNPDLVTDVFAYPYRRIDVYNIHPEAYQKVLEYLKNNFDKDNNNNELDGYVLSLSGFEKVPIGGEVNDSTFHYIGKNGKREYTQRRYYENANIINKNEIFSKSLVPKNVIPDNGKLKMYSYLNNDNVVYKNSDGTLISHPFIWRIGEKVNDYQYDQDDEVIIDLREKGLTEQQIKDYINKNLNYLDDTQKYNVDKSIFRPIEKKQQTQNNSSQQTSNSGNVVQKVKQTVKQTASKIRSFLGFQNGGQLKYYKNGK